MSAEEVQRSMQYKVIYLAYCKWNRKKEFECSEQKGGFFNSFMLLFVFAVVKKKNGVGNHNSSFGENA